MKAKLTLIAVIGAASVFAAAAIYIKNADHWPSVDLTQDQLNAAEDERNAYLEAGIDASLRSSNYSTNGDYLNYGATKTTWESDRVQLDAQGIPMVKYGNEFQYNPVTISQFALSEHGRGISTGDYGNFDAAVQKLIDIQDEDGAFRYDFKFRHYTNEAAYDEGWISGMAQGVALSAMARQYSMEPSRELLHAGNRSVDFLSVPANEGGPMTDLSDLDESLSDYIFFQEYITSPNVYTLNGFMFTLLGLHDWHQATDSDKAWELLLGGFESLKRLLPYYDLEHISAYDLSYITHEKEIPHMAARYHGVHINLLTALYSVSINKTLEQYLADWERYVKTDSTAE